TGRGRPRPRVLSVHGLMRGPAFPALLPHFFRRKYRAPVAVLTVVEPAPVIGFGVPATMAQDAPVPNATLDSSTKLAAEAGQEIERFPPCNVTLNVTWTTGAPTLTSWMPFTAGCCPLPRL